MPDSQALRAQRARNHRNGDHSLCRQGRCPQAPGSSHAEPIQLHAAEPRDGEEPLVASYREVLESAGRSASPEGMHVMHLATLFVQGKHTASGAAALSRELRAALDVAMRGAATKADALDELALRRDRKVFGA